ncbi:MAG: O-antigen polymerase [Chitinivibrionales bacterium]
MTFLFIFVAAIAAVSTSLRKKDFFSPVIFFIILYSLLLAINSLNLSSVQISWSPTSQLLFWGSVALFIGGCASITVLANIKFQPFAISFPAIRADLRRDAQTIDWKRFQTVWLICAVIFFFAYARSYMITGEIPLFSKSPESSRLHFFGASFLSNYAIHFAPPSMMLGIEILLFMQGRKKQKILVFIVSLSILFLYGTIVTRTDIFRFALFGVILYHYGKKNLSLKHIAVLLFAGAALFVMFSLIRVSHTATQAFLATSHLRMPKEYGWASNFYGYVANNFWNFDYAVRKFYDNNQSYPYGYGFYLFRSLFAVTFMEGPFSQMFGFQDIFNSEITRIKGWNTIIFTWHLCKDFSFYGLFLFSLFLGMSSMMYYCNTFIKTTLFRTSLWALIIGLIFLSFINAVWEFWMIPMNILFFALAHGKLKFIT